MLLFGNYGPYHVARWRAAAQYFGSRGINLVPVQLFEEDKTYPWESRGATAGIPLVTLFPGVREQRPGPLRAAARMGRFLKEARISWAAIPGYARWEFLAALLYLKLTGKVAVMMSESKADDFPRRSAWEWAKSWVARYFPGALVGGSKAAAYAASLGISPDCIFPGYDVVDNRHFGEAAARVRRRAGALRQIHGLPACYFLTVSRLVAKKNLPLVLRAYSRYCRGMGESRWHLVICGTGPQAGELQDLVHSLGVASSVHFPGFRQVEELPVFYGLAQAFILASSREEQWGLVVNEAMASGLPVLVSRGCGCALDLVKEGVNGFTFEPDDEHGLAQLMAEMHEGRWDLKKMGRASQRLIAAWSPERFAENLWRAFTCGATGLPQGRSLPLKQFDLLAEAAFSQREKPTELRVTPAVEVHRLMTLTAGTSDWVELLHQKRVLEVGAGECTFVPGFLALASPARYVASDLFPDRMSLAAANFTDSRVSYRQANVLALPFEAGEFELVLAFGLLHHLPDLEAALREIRRVLTPGGLLLFRDPCAENPLVWLRYRFGRISPNEWPLSRKKVVAALSAENFRLLTLNRFWLRFPQLPPGFWSTNLGGVAQKV